MISVPGHGRLTLVKAYALLRELDWYAGHRQGAGHAPIKCIEETRAALAEHVAHSLGIRDARAEPKKLAGAL